MTLEREIMDYDPFNKKLLLPILFGVDLNKKCNLKNIYLFLNKILNNLINYNYTDIIVYNLINYITNKNSKLIELSRIVFDLKKFFILILNFKILYIYEKLIRSVKNTFFNLFNKFIKNIKFIGIKIMFLFKILKSYSKILIMFLLFRFLLFYAVLTINLLENISNFDNLSLGAFDLEFDTNENISTRLGEKSERKKNFEQRCVEPGKIISETDENGFKLSKIIKTKNQFRYIFDREYPETTDIKTINPN
jgi:hypothetical protein